ncbi:MAG TPA: alginate export family protein, partial [Gemmataceae bacterium]
MSGSPRMGAGWAWVGLLAGAWLANGAGLARADDPPPSPPSVWTQAMPPAARRPAAPPAALPPLADAEPPTADAGAPCPPPAPPAAAQPGQQQAACAETCPPPKSVWDNVPPVHPVPRLGNFLVLPSGCGYYSGLDAILGDRRPKPPNYPYPPNGAMAGSFFDADYRYLDKRDNRQHDFFDPLKRVHLGDNWLFTTGGEVRFRYMDEVNSRFTGQNNEYDLFRTRVYGDLWYRDEVRLYVEYLYANSWNEDLAPLPVDVNQNDLLNLFVDLKVGEIGGRPIYIRGGRQELLYGSERLISPLDWANTRRTFQGVKAFYQGDKWDVDAFWVQPVTVSPSHFDSVDDALNLTGVWTTYRPRKGRALDFYALNLDRSGPSAPNQPQVPGAANVDAPTHFNI